MTTDIDAVALERACKVFAEATDYYVDFHPGLSSVSADKIRTGMRAALASAKPAQAGEYEGLAKRLAERAVSYRLGGPSSEHTASMLDEAASAIRTLEAERDQTREDILNCQARARQLAVAKSNAKARALSLETRLAAMGEALKTIAAIEPVSDEDVAAAIGAFEWAQEIARAILSTEASHEQR